MGASSHRLSGWAAVAASDLLFAARAWAQTLEDLEADLHLSRGAMEQGGGQEPFFGWFTILFLVILLVALGGIVFLGIRSSRDAEERSIPRGSEWEPEEGSYFLHVVFLAVGYLAIIIMLAYVPPALPVAFGFTTRLILGVSALAILIAHLLAARDEQTLPPSLKYLFSGSVVLAALFFNLAFKKWSFLQFSDPFYAGNGPYIALGCIILLVLAYSVFITIQHFKHAGDE